MKIDNKGKWLKKSVMAITFLSCLIPFHEAKSEMKPFFNGHQNEEILITQSFCPDSAGGMPLEDFFETRNFWIYICNNGDDYNYDLYYHGVEKKNRNNHITLPVYVEEGTGYVAENGNYTYIINGLSLSIYQGRKLLQEEPVMR